MREQDCVSAELRGMATQCPEALTDEELMSVLRGSEERGEREHVFEEIFRRYHVRVTSWCYRITRNRVTAADLSQEIFLKAYRHLHGFRGDSRLSTWLYAITRNHCLSSIGKRSTDPLATGEVIPLRLPDLTAADPNRTLEREQLCKRLWEMIGSTLEPMEARVITLHFAYGVPLAAITRQLALSNPSGAKAYVVNARRKLSRVIQRRRLNASLLPMARDAA